MTEQISITGHVRLQNETLCSNKQMFISDLKLKSCALRKIHVHWIVKIVTLVANPRAINFNIYNVNTSIVPIRAMRHSPDNGSDVL